jgi:hypothetical protein
VEGSRIECDDRSERIVRREPVGIFFSDGAVTVERRVVLLSRDPGLAGVADRLLENGDRVVHFRTAVELADWTTPPVAAVVLDSQPQGRRLSYKQVRDRYSGPLVMLLDRNERRPDLPPDGARQFLHRPFQVAELSRLLAAPAPELQPFEAAIIGAWSRHATAEPTARARPPGPSYRVSWRPSLRRRVRAWAATVVALVGLLVVFSVSDQGPCGAGCTSFGGAIAGATESATPLTSAPATGAGGGGDGGQPPGSGAASSQPPTAGGLPLVSGVGGLIESINPISPDDLTPPAGPQGIPGVPAPPGVPTPPDPDPPPTTPAPDPTPTPTPTTAPPTTAPPTTAPPTTAPPTTEPPTTGPPTTEPPTTEPPTTAPPTTEPPTTAPPTTEPPTTAPPTTAATTAAAPTT